MNFPPSAKPPRDPPAGLGPPQFGLRTLMWSVTAFAVLVAMAKFWSMSVIVGVVFLLISIGLHVAGNALGTELRKRRGRSPQVEVAHSSSEAAALPVPIEPMSETHLGKKKALGQLIWIVAIAGGILGALGGCIWTWYEHGERSTWDSYLIAVVAFGALGSFWSFLTVGFLQVLFSAVWQAIGKHSQEQKRLREHDQNAA